MGYKKKVRTVIVDKEDLYAAFEVRGIDARKVATEMHMSPRYFNNCNRSGVNFIVADRLKADHGIDVYAMAENRKKEKAEQIPMHMDSSLTYQEVAQAVAEGVQRAVEEIAKAYALYKVGGVQTLRPRMEKEPEHEDERRAL